MPMESDGAALVIKALALVCVTESSVPQYCVITSLYSPPLAQPDAAASAEAEIT